MSDPGTVRIDGARQLRRELRAASGDLDRMKAAHSAAATAVAIAAAAAAPRRTGRLASTVRGSGTNTMATIRAGYARVPYANPIHWGWPRRGIRANPWMSETAQRTQPQWVGIYADRVQAILDSIRGAA